MNELFNDLPDVLDAKALAHALSISKSGAYTLLNQKDFPTLQIGGRKRQKRFFSGKITFGNVSYG